MDEYGFNIGKKYNKKDIYLICQVPSKMQRGNWDTGYHNYENDWFIFCNIGVAGRTGHDYSNCFIGDELHWYAKNGTRLNQPVIQSLLKPEGNIFIFYREANRDSFTYAGRAAAVSWRDESPVQITWHLIGE